MLQKILIDCLQLTFIKGSYISLSKGRACQNIQEVNELEKLLNIEKLPTHSFPSTNYALKTRTPITLLALFAKQKLTITNLPCLSAYTFKEFQA